jgi:hypothetical protein
VPNVEYGRHAVVVSMPTTHLFAITAGRVFKHTSTSNELGTTTPRVTALRSKLFTQLGGVWLQLPHILILPFVWNDYLWATGLAGSFVGMICYFVATIFIFLSARRITHSSIASFVGTLVFIFNPNILYLQATPMAEPVCWATFTMACYFMLAWIQEEKTKYLILATASTCLATLARYDGWILVAVFPVLIVFIGLLKHYSLRKIEGLFFLLS